MTIRVLTGDCRDVLPTLEADSVHAVITSPPYYALRSYLDASHPDKHRELGSEPTPEAYLANMVQVFREVRRVLRHDGVCWVNMGDSYAANGVAGLHKASGSSTLGPNKDGLPGNQNWNVGDIPRKTLAGAKPKDLLMMPARLALALQADGWWLRSMLPWVKRSAMPESVTDRPTSAVEYVFLLTKQARYFYDADAVRQPLAAKTFTTFGCEHRPQGNDDLGKVKSDNWGSSLKVRKPKLNGAGEIAGRNMRNADLFFDSLTAPHGLITDADGNPLALDVNPAAFSQAHFATFPPKLIEPLIRAGTSERGCCAACGAPWVRTVERMDTGRTQKMADGWDTGKGAHGTVHRDGREAGVAGVAVMASVTTGWLPSCQHGEAWPPVPCTVLDPFAGAGTTLMVADRLQRDAIGIDLNPNYVHMATERITEDCPLFTSWPSAEPPEDARMVDLFSWAAD